MPGGQGRKTAFAVGVELDEDEVPDFDAGRVVGIDEVGAAVAFGREIDMQFGAGAAGAGVAHHPEVVFAAAGHDALFGKVTQPQLLGLEVGFGEVVAAEVGGVEALFREAPYVGEQLPRPVDGFFFEVVAEGPVAEHFEESVVVGVGTDIFEVVVLAAGANAFLGVGGSAGFIGAVGLPEKDRHKLVHARVGEEQVGRVGQQAGGGHNGVLLRCKEIEKRLADFR